MDAEEVDLIKIFKILLKNRKKILITGGVIAIVSTLITLLIPDKYKSTTSFNVVNPMAVDPVAQIREIEYEDFLSGKDNVYRAISIAESKEARKVLINNFDLINKYNIDKNNKSRAMQKAMKELKSNIYIETVENSNLIELSVYDRDSLQASQIANELAQYINMKISHDIVNKNKNILTSLKKQVNAKKKEINSLKDSLKKLRNKYKIMNPEKDGQLLTQELVKIQSKLNQVSSELNYYKKNNLNAQKINVLSAKKNSLLASYHSLKYNKGKSALNIENFSNGIDKIQALSQQLKGSIENYSKARDEYSKLKSSMNEDLEILLFSEKATPSYEKATPNRMLIVFISTFCSLLIACLAVIITTINKANQAK